MTVTQFFDNISALVNGIVIWMGNIWNFIVGEPILAVIVLAVPLCGLAVGMLTRLFRVN